MKTPYIEIRGLVHGDAKVRHGFFGRRGGVSSGLYYESLNCGPGTSDVSGSVAENRSIAARTLGADPANLVTLYQVHSPVSVILDKVPATRPEADASVTDRPGLMLGVLTADCGPVLLCGMKKDGSPVIGAAHAGWGGALKGVLENTVTGMTGLGAELSSIRAAVGPCIAGASYEVSAGFETPFLDHDPDSERFFKGARRKGHLMFDLPGYIAFRLAGAGVGTVLLSGTDTYAQEREYFSFRRATHRKEPDYGRQLSAIVIGG